jgi:hypothetical protein
MSIVRTYETSVVSGKSVYSYNVFNAAILAM